MVDKDDILLNVNINYNNNQIKIGKVKDLPSIDVIKNKIMRYLEIPNTKDYLYLSYKDDKGSGQKIGDDENIFKYAKEKPKSHQTEYILELDLSISDEVDKFKKFFNGEIDEKKYNENKKELDKIIKENEIVKKKIEEFETLMKKIIDKKKKIIITKEKEKKKLQIELLKKELENVKLNFYINELSKKYKEQINKFFENGKAIEIKNDIIKNKENNIIKFKEQILKYFNDLKEKNIKFKNTLQKIKKDSEKDKSLNSSSKKDSEQNNINEKFSKNMESFNNNEQDNNNFINMPSDSLRNKNKNNFEKQNLNNLDEAFQNDKFFKFLNELFFKSLNLSEREKILLKKYHYELKNSNQSSLNKFKFFFNNIIVTKLEEKIIHTQDKKKLEVKSSEIEKYLKGLEKEDENAKAKTAIYKNNIFEKDNTQSLNNKDNNTYYPDNLHKFDIYNNKNIISNENNHMNNIGSKLKNQYAPSYIDKFSDNNSRNYSNDYNYNKNIMANIKDNKRHDYDNIGQNNRGIRTYYNYNYNYKI